MDPQTHAEGARALQGLEAVLERGPGAPHEEVSDALRALVRFRNRILDAVRQGRAPAGLGERVNALVSLGFGTAYPLAGFHRDRLQQTCAALKELLDAQEGAAHDDDRP